MHKCIILYIIFSEVHKGQDKTNLQCLVALKKIITERETEGVSLCLFVFHNIESKFLTIIKKNYFRY